MKDLFPVCVRILDREKRPIHYQKLAALALEKEMGVFLPKSAFLKNAENVREKLLLAGQCGTFYAGSPLCVGGLRHWFVVDQLQFTTDWITIQGNAQAGANGAFEALMRSRHMVIHNPSLRNTELLNKARSSGLVLEHHVAGWFKAHYPTLYREPENQGIWDRPCNHDFKLASDDWMIKVDVSGPDWRGQYGHRGRKPKADVHLLCRITGADCTFEGVVRGESFGENCIPMTASSPTAFLVWLNCFIAGIDYRLVIASLSTKKAHAA